MKLAATDVKIFVPAKSFEVSKKFYVALGWQLNWEHDGGLAELELGGVRFLLQNFYVKLWAENFVIYVRVEDGQAWFDHVSAVIGGGEFPQARVNPPKQEPWGDYTTYAWDPSGVLIHFAQLRSQAASTSEHT